MDRAAQIQFKLTVTSDLFARNPRDLVAALNGMAADELARISPTEWDENHISLSLVRSIREVLSLAGQLVPSMDQAPLNIQAEAYKVTGAMEQTYGDIAVAIANADTRTTGLGFYEAKAADYNGEYPAFNMRQLRRLTAAPRLSLLLYERAPSAVQDDDLVFRSPTYESARVRVLGANLASRFPASAFAFLHPHSFGYQFVTRLLSGRDLDYSRAPRAALQRWLSATKRTAPYFVSVTISEGPGAPPPPPDDAYVPIPRAERHEQIPASHGMPTIGLPGPGLVEALTPLPLGHRG